MQEIKRGSYTIGKDKERESLISEMSSQRTTRPRVHSTSAKTKFQKDVFSMEVDQMRKNKAVYLQDGVLDLEFNLRQEEDLRAAEGTELEV